MFFFKVEKVGSSVSKNTTKTSGRILTEYFDAINETTMILVSWEPKGTPPINKAL